MSIHVDELVQLQTDAVVRWHAGPFDYPLDGLLAMVCQQHEANFQLWHEEDKARCPMATDAQIAEVKRNIDRINQRRNDLIETIDDELAKQLADVSVDDDASENTETPGSAIDRLSIMAIRLFHYQEQSMRREIDDDFRQTILDRIELCGLQQSKLSTSLQELLDDLFQGRKRHQTVRQLKMYNDPRLNPAIYDAQG